MIRSRLTEEMEEKRSEAKGDGARREKTARRARVLFIKCDSAARAVTDIS